MLLENSVGSERLWKIFGDRLQKYGFQPTVKYVPKSEIVNALQKRNYDIVFVTFGFPSGDFGFGLYSYFLEQPSYFIDEQSQVHNMFEKLGAESDFKMRFSMYEEINRRIAAFQGIYPIFSSSIAISLGRQWSFRNDYHSGVDFTALDIIRVKQ